MKSNQVVPAVPDRPFYDPGVLWLFKRFADRAAFSAATGEQAPAFDPKRTVKKWFDTTPVEEGASLDEMVSYEVFGFSGEGVPAYKTIRMTVLEASTVNLPGLRTYAPYVVAPTTAEFRNNFGPNGAMNPTLLSTEKQALAMLAEVNGLAIQDVSKQDPGAWVFNGETRRPWQVQLPSGDWHEVGLLLKTKNINGVGAPGAWDFSTSQPHWTPIKEEAGLQVTGEVPVPARRLASNEKIKPTMFGTVIYRTDKESAYNTSPVTAGGAGLTPAQDASLRNIEEKVSKILKLLAS